MHAGQANRLDLLRLTVRPSRLPAPVFLLKGRRQQDAGDPGSKSRCRRRAVDAAERRIDDEKMRELASRKARKTYELCGVEPLAPAERQRAQVGEVLQDAAVVLPRVVVKASDGFSTSRCSLQAQMPQARSTRMSRQRSQAAQRQLRRRQIQTLQLAFDREASLVLRIAFPVPFLVVRRLLRHHARAQLLPTAQSLLQRVVTVKSMEADVSEVRKEQQANARVGQLTARSG
mmetsp:Transcript_12657/g.46751  ORF Transcript_12657/g.46751 Transcript_12657/m.46751 type:complete len:231 (-) Transcript_12657:379-1071(-)